MSGINKYNDISEMIKSDIFNGKLKENMALPSIRKLAQRYKVNPATVVRALHILRNQKIVYSNRTNGFYVCEDISQVRQNLAEQVIADFLHNMSSIGIFKFRYKTAYKGSGSIGKILIVEFVDKEEALYNQLIEWLSKTLCVTPVALKQTNRSLNMDSFYPYYY